MMHLRVRTDLKCPKHPLFNPAKSGVGGVKAGCATCFALCDIQAAYNRLVLTIQRLKP
jgi:hypothetical protein